MKPLRHVHDLYNGALALDWPADWPYLLVVAGMVVLSGSLIFFVFAIQDWCAASSWDYEDRWNGTKAFAAAFIVAGLLLVLFHGFLLQIWLHALSVLFWYPAFWWCLCLLLSPALALLAERVEPRTKPIERALLPAEVAGQQQQQAVAASDKKATRAKAIRKKQIATQGGEKESASPSPRQRNTRRDPRPIYQAWAVPQIVLPPVPPQEKTSPSGATPGSKRDKRDEGESLEDIF